MADQNDVEVDEPSVTVTAESGVIEVLGGDSVVTVSLDGVATSVAATASEVTLEVTDAGIAIAVDQGPPGPAGPAGPPGTGSENGYYQFDGIESPAAPAEGFNVFTSTDGLVFVQDASGVQRRLVFETEVDIVETRTPLQLSASGLDTTVLTPAAGNLIRLYWYHLHLDPEAVENVVASLRFGARDPFFVDDFEPGLPFSHSTRIEGVVDEPLSVALSKAGIHIWLNIEYVEVTP